LTRFRFGPALRDAERETASVPLLFRTTYL